MTGDKPAHALSSCKWPACSSKSPDSQHPPVTEFIDCRARVSVNVEAWRREHKEERPKKSLDGLTPAACAHRLMQNQLKQPGTPKPCAAENGGDVAISV